MSLTITGLLALVLGFIIDDVGVAGELAADIVTVAGLLMTWYGRLRLGDITWYGARK